MGVYTVWRVTLATSLKDPFCFGKGSKNKRLEDVKSIYSHAIEDGCNSLTDVQVITSGRLQKVPLNGSSGAWWETWTNPEAHPPSKTGHLYEISYSLHVTLSLTFVMFSQLVLFGWERKSLLEVSFHSSEKTYWSFSSHSSHVQPQSLLGPFHSLFSRL